MQKLGVLASSVLATGTEAFRTNSMFSNNPFVGENANAQIIEGETRSTHRATPVSITSGKYDSIVSKINRKAYKSPETKLYEAIFGEQEQSSNTSAR